MAFSIGCSELTSHGWMVKRPRLGGGDAGQLANAHLRAIDFHHDVLDQRGRGLAGADAGKLVHDHLLGLAHLVFRLE